jgi:hypothetical protein
MWSGIGQGIGTNFANMAFGIGDSVTAGPIWYLFGASSGTEALRNWLTPNIECQIPQNGFYVFGALWGGTAAGAAAGALAGVSAAGRVGQVTRIVDDVLPTPQVNSPKLQNLVNNLYKGTTNPNRVGNGTTMDAIRNELATGVPTGGRMHTIKGQETLQGLTNWLRRNPDADYGDRLVAQSLADDLARALQGMQ